VAVRVNEVIVAEAVIGELINLTSITKLTIYTVIRRKTTSSFIRINALISRPT